MRKERKAELLLYFPPVPEKIMETMTEGKCAHNYAVFLSRGDELFVRCFHKYHGRAPLIERQRYVFAKDGCCRYGSYDGKEWSIRAEFREPVFCASCYGHSFDNSYTVLNFDAIKKSCMKYSCIELYHGGLWMEYLQLYCKHPNVEYLMKAGYDRLIGDEEIGYYWGYRRRLAPYSDINWKSNDLLKMLGLNRTEFKALQGRERYYCAYLMWREKMPKYSVEKLIALVSAFGNEFGRADKMHNATGVSLIRLARYICEQEVRLGDYIDYLDQCRMLHYDTHDTAVCMPHDFEAMHTRCSELIRYKTSEEIKAAFTENYPARKRLEYRNDSFLIRQPEYPDEITAEGAALSHCVGGYTKRHAQGALNILFIRRADDPDTPFYTMELSTSGIIIQVRGDHNCSVTDDLSAFIDEYKRYIAPIFTEKKKKARKTA